MSRVKLTPWKLSTFEPHRLCSLIQRLDTRIVKTILKQRAENVYNQRCSLGPGRTKRNRVTDIIQWDESLLDFVPCARRQSCSSTICSSWFAIVFLWLFTLYRNRILLLATRSIRGLLWGESFVQILKRDSCWASTLWTLLWDIWAPPGHVDYLQHSPDLWVNSGFYFEQERCQRVREAWRNQLPEMWLEWCHRILQTTLDKLQQLPELCPDSRSASLNEMHGWITKLVAEMTGRV